MNKKSGTMQYLTYFSQETGVDRHVNVYFPPSFSADKKYPVLYVLHGIGGTENEWLENSDPRSLLDELIDEGKCREMLVVFANGRATVPDSVPQDIFSSQSIRAFVRFENDLLGSLIPFIEDKFNVATDRMSRALCGLSMGGGQALNFGLGRPDLFGWVGAFSPAPNTDTTRFRLNTDTGNPFIWMVCGDQDDLLGVSKNTHEYLGNQGIEHGFKVIPGGHDWGVWTFGLREFAGKIFSSVN